MATLVHPKIYTVIKECPKAVKTLAKTFGKFCAKHSGGKQQIFSVYTAWPNSREVMSEALQGEVYSDIAATFTLTYTYESWSVYHNDTAWEEKVEIMWRIQGEEFSDTVDISKGRD
jgi:hypothetical protein